MFVIVIVSIVYPLRPLEKKGWKGSLVLVLVLLFDARKRWVRKDSYIFGGHSKFVAPTCKRDG
jgi:hypothetical protein